MNAHDFEFRTIDGERLPMSRFAEKAVLVVNTASECGLTPQYAGLQSLWEGYRERGLVVLGVPSNDFGAQEPGDETAIKSFCAARYGVDFPMTSKNTVIGGDAHPLYRWVEEQTGEAGTPKWNFHKYLIAPNGDLAGVFGSKVAPDDPELIGAIEELLFEDR